MSFNNKNFSVMAYANGFTLWNYSSEDTLPTIKTAGYFNETAPFIRAGDMVLVAANNKAVVTPAILAVSTVANDIVTIASLTA